MNRMDTKRRASIVRCLVEGVGIRSTCRVTGASKGAVTKLITDLGPVCEAYQDAALRQLPCRVFEADEIWSFIAMKQRRVPDERHAEFGVGDTWCFTALCTETKLIPSWLVAPRDTEGAYRFMCDLAGRVNGRIQITADGHSMYLDAVEGAFAGNADFAQLVKLYGAPQEPEKRYSPARCLGSRRQTIQGSPDPANISTSLVERSNLGIRMGLRRYTRLTNGHSKKLENHCAALAIYFMHYNFARLHSTIRCTPAMKADVAKKLWSVEDIVKLLEVTEPASTRPATKETSE